MSRWFRHYAGMMRDDKLVRVAIRSKQPIERVSWVWGAILESAAEIDDGGRYDFDAAEAAYFLRADEADLIAVEAALADAGRVAENRVVNWGARQFQSDRSAKRTADYRDRKRSEKLGGDAERLERDAKVASQSNGGVTSHERHCDSPETETETETEPSQAKASEGRTRKRAARSPEKPKFDLPDWVPAEPWQAFVDMRRAMEAGPKKIPFTVGAAKGIVADLERFRADGHDLAAILTKSAVNGYRGVFAPEHAPKPAVSSAPMGPIDQQAYLAKLQAAPHLRGIATTDEPRRNGASPPRGFGQLAAGIAGGMTVQ